MHVWTEANNKDDKDLFNYFARPFPGEGGD